MVKRLAAQDLVAREPYRGVVLAAEGERIALELVRHHRLVERFLAEILGVPWDEVHDEAERWEHVLSEGVEHRIDAALGFPTSDPHGAPIPSRDGTIRKPPTTPLATLVPGEGGVVAEVSDRDARVLRYFGEVGLYPGVPVEVVAVEPFEGPLTVRVGAGEHVLARELADEVLVAEAAA